MSKNAPKATVDLSRYQRSTFTLTFAVEVLGLDVWEDFNEGKLELGPYSQGVKIQYQLYPGQSYDLDILIWPHVAKIWCGSQYGWVRTWRFLERRWLTFSIRHAFPVRVVDLRVHVATVSAAPGVAALGTNAKNDKNFEVSLPHVGFRMRRYFAPVLEAEESVFSFIQDLIWKPVEQFIPWSCFDDRFDVPGPVTDVRHQDACIDSVRELILKRHEPQETFEEPQEEDPKMRIKRESKTSKEKEKKKVVEVPKIKFEIRLSGETIMAGAGRVIPYETVGDLPPDTPEIIVLISSNNLPAQDDLPIVFVNIDNLCEIPLNELKILRITELYVKWQIGEEVHCSEPQPLRNKTLINFNDHKALPLPYEQLSTITSEFADKITIELRGIKLTPIPKDPKLFGYEKSDRDYVKYVPKPSMSGHDFLIAIAKIDGNALTRGVNTFLRGEYPLYPPPVSVKPLEREGYCTNDINCVRSSIVPELVVKPEVILRAQMSLEVSIGVVGCKARQLVLCYSRMFCATKNSTAVMDILRKITDINDDILISGTKDELLTGFTVDTGDVAVLFVEGPRDGHILHVWGMTEDFYPDVNPLFSCSARYSSRIYPELLAAVVPFAILKMFVPLGVLLACPPAYARPTLPLPTRSAMLKIGRLIGDKLRDFPSRCQMPTAAELKSFRLELCVAPRPIATTDKVLEETSTQVQPPSPDQRKPRINWDK